MNKEFKKIISILTLCLLMALLLCACMNKKVAETTFDDSTSIQYTTQPATTRAQPKTTAPAEEVTKEENGDDEMNQMMYCIWPEDANVRAGASTDDDILGIISYGAQVKVKGNVTEDGVDTGWLIIDYNGQTAYVWGELFDEEMP